MEPLNPDNFPGPGPEVKERQRIARKREAKRVRSWTVKNEVKDALRRMTAGAA